MNRISSTEALGIAARYAAQIRELLIMNSAAAGAPHELKQNTTRSELAAPELPQTSSTAIDLRA